MILTEIVVFVFYFYLILLGAESSKKSQERELFLIIAAPQRNVNRWASVYGAAFTGA